MSDTIDIAKVIEKEFGEDILRSANVVLDEESTVIPLTPALDIAIGGGVPDGSNVIFTGQPKCGKTTTSLHFAANCQKKEHGSREVYFMNVEGRLKKRDLEGIKNLDLDKFHVIGSKQGKILAAEDYLSIAEKIIATIPYSVVIIDSYSALCTANEITSGMDKMQRADGAKLLAKFCRKTANIIPVNKNIVIGITHLMGNPTGYGAEFKEKSGQAVAYHVDVKLRARRFSPWEVGGIQIGQEIEWQVITSAIGAPGQRVSSFLRYGHGIDEETELVRIAIDATLIRKAGAWFTLDFVEGDEKPKFHGVENTRQALIENPKLKTQLYQEIKNFLGLS